MKTGRIIVTYDQPECRRLTGRQYKELRKIVPKDRWRMKSVVICDGLGEARELTRTLKSFQCPVLAFAGMNITKDFLDE